MQSCVLFFRVYRLERFDCLVVEWLLHNMVSISETVLVYERSATVLSGWAYQQLRS